MNIGIFDSGIGGLNLLNKLIKTYNHNYFYYADNKNIPYGNKTYKFIKRNVFYAMDYFLQNEVDVVIIACNTVSTMLGDLIKNIYPFEVVTITPNFKNVIKYDKFVLLATDNTTNYILKNANAIAKQCNLQKAELLAKLQIVNTSELAYLTETVAPNFYYNYRYIRDILKQISINIPILLGCTHYTYYQQYINSLGYKTYSEIEYFDKIGAILQKNTNLCGTLTIKVTNFEKISTFYSIIDKLL